MEHLSPAAAPPRSVRSQNETVDSPVLRNRDASAPPDQVAKWYINPALVRPGFVFVGARKKEKKQGRRNRWSTLDFRFFQVLSGSFRFFQVMTRSRRDRVTSRGLLTVLTDSTLGRSFVLEDYHVVSFFPRRRCPALSFTLCSKEPGVPGSPRRDRRDDGRLRDAPRRRSSRLTITRRPFRRLRRCCRQTDGKGGGGEGEYAVECAVRTYYRLTPPRQRRNELARYRRVKSTAAK